MKAAQACTGLGAQLEGEARGHAPGGGSIEAQGTRPVGGGQWSSEEQAPGPVARSRDGPGPWGGAGEEEAGAGAVGAVGEAAAGERWGSRPEEGEVPVGSETPSGVEANEAVGKEGASRAQDQQGRGAGSVTERPSPATDTDAKSLMGPVGIQAQPSESPTDRSVAQAGEAAETGGSLPAHRATSEPRLPEPWDQHCVPEVSRKQYDLGPTGALADSATDSLVTVRAQVQRTPTGSPNKRSEELLVLTDSKIWAGSEKVLPRVTRRRSRLTGANPAG